MTTTLSSQPAERSVGMVSRSGGASDTTTRDDAEQFDVVVIGGGQAGLATGYHLARHKLRFMILDASPRVGDAWRALWDSLRVFSPARYDGMPGMPFPAPPHSGGIGQTRTPHHRN